MNTHMNCVPFANWNIMSYTKAAQDYLWSVVLKQNHIEPRAFSDLLGPQLGLLDKTNYLVLNKILDTVILTFGHFILSNE